MPAGDTRAARRYAGALFRVALKGNEVDASRASLDTLAEALKNPRLLGALTNPRFPQERRQKITEALFAGQGPAMTSFVKLLDERSRLDLLPEVARSFGRLADEHNKVTDAVATTAQPLSPEQEAALKAKIEATTGYTVRLKTKVDASILGGIVVRVGDRQFDGSVTTQLRAMRDALKRVRIEA